MKRKVIPIVVALTVLLAGCAGLGGGDAGGDSAELSGDSNGAAPAPDSNDGDASAENREAAQESRPLQLDRAIIRSGTIQLQAADFETTRAAIADRARNLGGYVSGSASTQHTGDNVSWTTGYVVVRVPTERFAEALAFARDRGTVLDEETKTEDVSEQLVDLEARLENNRARRDRLRSFYERANTTGELLRIEERLTSVQSTIEKLQAEKRALEDRVSFATLRVEITEPRPDASQPDPRNEGTPLVGAFVDSGWSVVGLFYGFALFATRLTPYVLAFGLPLLAVGAVARRRFGGIPRFGRGGTTAAHREGTHVRETGSGPNAADREPMADDEP